MNKKLLPALQNVDISYNDIVANDIPLLLSRKSMKKANMTLDFKNDHGIIFDQSIQLLVTQSVTLHYPYKSI